MTAKKREHYLIAWQDEYGNKNWAKTRSKNEAGDMFHCDELADGTGIAIQYKATITGTSYRPAAFKRMQKNRKYNLDMSVGTYEEFKQLAGRLWNTEYGRIKETKKYLHLITGGWSENEEALRTLQRTAYWHRCWVREERGGAYTLEIKRGA